MKKTIFILSALVFVALSAISCKQEVGKGVSFDTATFNAQKEKWHASGLEEYSFKYSFHGWRPDYIEGDVVVTKDGKTAKVVCDEERDDDGKVIKEGEVVANDSIYYIESIDALFDSLYARYERAKKDVDSGDYDYIQIDCKYNEKYGYPEYISDSSSGGKKDKQKKDDMLVGDLGSNFSFKMKDFSTEK